MELLLDPAVWLSFATLLVLEIVLGVDNLVFISIISEKLPPSQASKARRIGLILALLMRLVMLAMIAWLVGLSAVAFTIAGHEFGWSDLILIGGGLFLLAKGVLEIHDEVEGDIEVGAGDAAKATMTGVIAQILALDFVFSIDSILTAVGIAEHLPVMMAAVIIAMIVMVIAADPLANFIERHPTTKMLALSFLTLIGAALIADGFGFHVPKGYIYAPIAFSILVEGLNLVAAKSRSTNELRAKVARRKPKRPAKAGVEGGAGV